MKLMAAQEQTGTECETRTNCCPLYHEAVELVGRRWTGAILRVLMDGPLRFSEVAQTIPELSDRLLSERMKELESRGLVKRHADPDDGRRSVMSVTEAGRQVLGDRRNKRTEQLARALSSGFTPPELEQLMVAAPLLERLAQNI